MRSRIRWRWNEQSRHERVDGHTCYPISTGTNNAFPVFIEPTVAGTALGLVSTGAVDLEDVSNQSKLIHVADHEGDIDLALIDAVAVDDPLCWVIRAF